MLDHFLEEKRKAEKLVLVRYQEYNATILGADTTELWRDFIEL